MIKIGLLTFLAHLKLTETPLRYREFKKSLKPLPCRTLKNKSHKIWVKAPIEAQFLPTADVCANKLNSQPDFNKTEIIEAENTNTYKHNIC